MSMEVLVETSARHVHVTQEVLETLFGKGYELTKKKDLSQPGQYACAERVDIVGPKKTLSGVSILGGVLVGRISSSLFVPLIQIAYSSADKGGVKNKGFNKAVMRSPQNFIVIGLADGTHRIGSCVDDYRLGISLDNHSYSARKNGFYEIADLGGYVCFNIGTEFVRKLSRRFQVSEILFLRIEKIRHDFNHDFILAEAIDEIKLCIVFINL